MKIKFYKIQLIILLCLSCLFVEGQIVDTPSVIADPMESSAIVKEGLPWFAGFQVGEHIVEGFPGESVEEKNERMNMWRDSKYGLFIHWGPQSAKSSGENSGAEDIQNFNPVEFNAEEWVLTAKKLGFKYMVITAKHHAGFSMFDSKYTDFDIIDATPFKRDPIKELSEACARHHFQLGIYYSIWDIHHPDYSLNIGNPDYKKYQTFMLGQIEELLTNYGPIVSLWFDGEWAESWTVERANELRNLVRKLQPNTILANRIGQRRTGDGDHASPENFMPYIGDQQVPWEGCARFDGSWFYNGTNNSKTVDWALYNLCYATSRGGNFLMNLGPTPEGTFLKPSVEKLEQIGEWLEVNGESIYEAEKGPHYMLEWGTCTRKQNTLYYQIFDYPEDGKLIIPGLKNEIKSVTFLADKSKKSLLIKQNEYDLEVTLPGAPPYKLANVLKVELRDEPIVDNSIRASIKSIKAMDFMREVPACAYFLPAGFAKIHGEKLHFYFGTGAGAQRENLKGWTEKSDWAEWDIFVEEKGTYNLEITYGSWVEGGKFEVLIAGQSFQQTVQKIEKNPKAKISPLSQKYETFTLGQVQLKPGRHLLAVKPIQITEDAKKLHQGLMVLRDITLVTIK